jgi:beta-N-acetylglucosaminidase
MLGTSAAALAAAAISGVSSPTARAEESLDLQWARATLAKMDLNEKVNQLFIHQVFGTDPHGTDPRNQELYGVGSPVEMIQKFQPGGIILTPETGTFDGSKDHIMGWNRTLDETVKSIGTGVPLHLITRQEPYQLARQGIPATDFPSSIALGAIGGGISNSWGFLQEFGQELRALGFTAYLGVPADIESDPVSPASTLDSFGADVEKVTNRVWTLGRMSVVSGPLGGVHSFPGKGATTIGDNGLPVLNRSREEWDAREAVPFKKVANTAYSELMLVGHIVAPGLDPSGTPASLSEPIVTGILRKEYEYGGTVITEALNTPEIRSLYDDGELAVRALEAGVDQLLMSAAPEQARAAVLEAVNSGRISLEALDKKIIRILYRKRGFRNYDDDLMRHRRDDIGHPNNRQKATSLAQRAITAVSNDGLLPVAAGSQLLLVGPFTEFPNKLQDALQANGVKTTIRIFDERSGPDSIDAFKRAADELKADAVVVLTKNAYTTPEQVNLVNELSAAGLKVIAVAIGLPYDVGQYTATAKLCTYSDQLVMAAPLADIITGKAKPEGKLPVSVPTADGSIAIGTGLTW